MIENRCTAHKKNGEQCKRAANNGMNVCNSHGGRAPQVRRKAQERILMAADRAAYKLVMLMQNPEVPFNVQLAAAKDLLDRSNVVGTTQVAMEVSTPQWEINMRKAIKVRVKYNVDSAEDIEDAEVVEEDAEQLALYGSRVDDDAEEDRLWHEERDRRKWRQTERRSPRGTPPPPRLPDPPETEDYEAHPLLRQVSRAELLRRANAPETGKLRPRRPRGQ